MKKRRERNPESQKPGKPKKDSGIGRIKVKKGTPGGHLVEALHLRPGLFLVWDGKDLVVKDLAAAVKVKLLAQVQIDVDHHGKE